MTDTSKEALRLLNERMCAKVNDGRTIFAENVADMLDAIKALAAENDRLKARVAELEDVIIEVMGSMTMFLDDPSRMDDIPSCIRARQALKNKDQGYEN